MISRVGGGEGALSLAKRANLAEGGAGGKLSRRGEEPPNLVGRGEGRLDLSLMGMARDLLPLVGREEK